jgi:hypothetical protein
MFGHIILILCIAAIVLCIGLLIRNERVYRFRTKLIDRIATAYRADGVGVYDMWRWNEYEAVSYREMVLKFWKSPASLYEQDPARPIR